MTKYSRRKQRRSVKYSRRKQRGGAPPVFVPPPLPVFVPPPLPVFVPPPLPTLFGPPQAATPAVPAGTTVVEEKAKRMNEKATTVVEEKAKRMNEKGTTVVEEKAKRMNEKATTHKSTTNAAKTNLDNAYNTYKTVKTPAQAKAVMTAALEYLTAAGMWAANATPSEQNDANIAKEYAVNEVIGAEMATGLKAPPDVQQKLHKVRTNTAMLAAVVALRDYNSSVNKAAQRENLLNTANAYLTAATNWAANAQPIEQIEANTTKANAEQWRNDIQQRSATNIAAELRNNTNSAKTNLNNANNTYTREKTPAQAQAVMTAALAYLKAADMWAENAVATEKNDANNAKNDAVKDVIGAEITTGLKALPDVQQKLHKVRTNTAKLAADVALTNYTSSGKTVEQRVTVVNAANAYLTAATNWVANPLSAEQNEATTAKTNAQNFLNNIPAAATAVAAGTGTATTGTGTAGTGTAGTGTTTVVTQTAQSGSEYGFNVIEPSDYGGDNTVSFTGNGAHMSFRAASDKCASEAKCYGFVFVTNPEEAKDITNLYNNPTVVKGHAHFKAYKSSQGRAACSARPACGTTHRFFEKMVTPIKLDNNTIQTALGGDKGFKWPDLTCTPNCKSFPVSPANFYPKGCSSTLKNLSDVEKEAAYLAKPAYTAATGSAKTTLGTAYMNAVVAYRAAASTWATWAAWTGSSEKAAANKSKAEATKLVNDAANLTSIAAPAETVPMPPASGGGRKKTLRKKRNTGKKASKTSRRKLLKASRRK